MKFSCCPAGFWLIACLLASTFADEFAINNEAEFSRNSVENQGASRDAPQAFDEKLVERQNSNVNSDSVFHENQNSATVDKSPESSQHNTENNSEFRSTNNDIFLRSTLSEAELQIIVDQQRAVEDNERSRQREREENERLRQREREENERNLQRQREENEKFQQRQRDENERAHQLERDRNDERRREQEKLQAYDNLKLDHERSLTAFDNLKRDHERNLQEFTNVRNQFTITKDLLAVTESNLADSLRKTEDADAFSVLTLASLKRDLANCQIDLLNGHSSANSRMTELQLELEMHQKESGARIEELQKEAEFCSAPHQTGAHASAGEQTQELNDDEKPSVTYSVLGKLFLPFTSFQSSILNFSHWSYHTIFRFSHLQMFHKVAIVPVSTRVCDFSSSVYGAVCPIAHGAASHVGNHWNNVVVPPYKVHLEPHVSKVTSNMQQLYVSYLKDHVGTYVEPAHTFLWDKVNRVAYNVYSLFEGDGFWERVGDLPLNFYSLFAGAFMTAVTYVQGMYGMQTIAGSYSETVAMNIVALVSVTLSILLRKQIMGLGAVIVFVLLAPIFFLVFTFSKLRKFLDWAVFGSKGKGKKKQAYHELPLTYSDTGVAHGSPDSQGYSSMAAPARPMMSSDLWSRDEKITGYYGADSSLNGASDPQNYAPPMASTLRPMMSTDSNSYYGAEPSHALPEIQHFVPHLSSSVHHSVSVDQWTRGDNSSHLVPENHRHSSIPPTAPPMMGNDHWSYKSTSHQGASTNVFPTFAYAGSRSNDDDQLYQDNA